MAKKVRKKSGARRGVRFDAARYLKSEADIVGYLKICMDEAGDDSKLVAAALGDVARAYGMSRLAREVGLSRVGLHKALNSSGNPSFDTILRVTRALGLKFVPTVA